MMILCSHLKPSGTMCEAQVDPKRPNGKPQEALVPSLGHCGPGPCRPPWALVGLALVASPGLLWAGALWGSPGTCGPGPPRPTLGQCGLNPCDHPLRPLWARPLWAHWALDSTPYHKNMSTEKGSYETAM